MAIKRTLFRLDLDSREGRARRKASWLKRRSEATSFPRSLLFRGARRGEILGTRLGANKISSPFSRPHINPGLIHLFARAPEHHPNKQNWLFYTAVHIWFHSYIHQDSVHLAKFSFKFGQSDNMFSFSHPSPAYLIDVQFPEIVLI